MNKIAERISFEYGFSVRINNEKKGEYPVYGSNGIIGFIDNYKIKGPGVIIGRKGSVGEITFAQKNFTPTDTTYYLKIIDENRDNLLFWYYFLKVLGVNKLNTHSSVPGLSRDTVYNLNLGIIKIPERKDQEQIVKILSTIDEKISLNNKINEELEKMAKALYEYWFVQFNFPNEEGKPYKSSGGKMVYNEELKRKIPKGWEIKSLSKVISRSGTGLNPRKNFKLGKGDNFYVTIKNIEQNKVILDDKCDRVDDKAIKIINKRSDLRPGDILFTSIQPVGITYYVHETPKDWNINESVFTIRPNYDEINSEFLFMLLSSDEMKIFTLNSSAGSIHKGIRHEELKEFKLPYKDPDLVKHFSIVLKPILQKIDKLNQENYELKKLRDCLLPLLMNGQVKVK
tara:strand:+ start:708 stop:1904 length:1197 start_codon:yes stop_codon:yes gene_type:complete